MRKVKAVRAKLTGSGSTSLSFILHSAPTIPIGRLVDYDHAHGYTISDRTSPSCVAVTLDPSTLPISNNDAAMLRSLRAVSWDEVVSRLVEVFLAQVAPTMPIICRQEVTDAGPTLRHAMAAVAAARKACPREVFVALRYILRRDIVAQGESLVQM